MGDDDSASNGESAVPSAKAEKEAIYPDEGYVLVEMDMLKPPGEVLTPLVTHLKLTELSISPTTDLTDHVVYDPEGNAYSRSSLQKAVEGPDAEQIETLHEHTRSGDKRTERHALFGFAEIATEQPDRCLDAIPLLTEKLEAPEPDICAMALEALATIAETHPDEASTAVEDILPFLDPAGDTRLHSDAIEFVTAIAEQDTGVVIDAAPKLTALLQDDTEATVRAIVALKRIAEAYPDAVVPAAPDLQTYVEDGDSPQRVGALAVLGMISKEYPDVAESVIPTAADLLGAGSKRLRANAAGLLADLADEYPDQVQSTVPEAIELLADKDEKARYNATSILARVAKKQQAAVEPAINPLIDVLEDEFPDTRANACWALGYLEAGRALDRLETIVESDPSEDVRNAASFAVSEVSEDL